MRRIAAVILGTVVLTGMAVTSAHADGNYDFGSRFNVSNDSGGIEYTQDASGGWGSDDDE